MLSKVFNRHIILVGGLTFSYLKLRNEHNFAQCKIQNSVSVDDNMNNNSVRPEKHELLSTQVFFRHGARTPITVIKGIEQVSYSTMSNSHSIYIP